MALAQTFRRRAVERLGLGPGDVVLDVGCGTGLSFPLIEERIGAQGALIGLELSPEMLEKARERVERHGWRNVTLLQSPVEEAQIVVEADAALFVLTHDILRSPPALENVLRHVKPGGRVVAAGGKWAPWWALPVNVYVALKARRYVTTFEGFQQPWSHLARLVGDLQVESALGGAVYICWGTMPRPADWG